MTSTTKEPVHRGATILFRPKVDGLPREVTPEMLDAAAARARGAALWSAPVKPAAVAVGQAERAAAPMEYPAPPVYPPPEDDVPSGRVCSGRLP
jgi:hypothetical protein